MTAMVSAGKMCMTGASGYITSWFVKLLLHRGYTVNASVHDPSTFSIFSFLFSFEVSRMEEGDEFMKNA
ncbi:hypothetical protein EUGRSUZ_E02516 [Eucalyptus grandis]|uniref:Uncharacterized protein n=2 Tax=Eucalyptus grandis TaxID=71139 RepID=A0ACC3KX21_EUCGR|nr:hypothetical protein EUGRSUZ_E02516 [Eucalyptus grandis]